MKFKIMALAGLLSMTFATGAFALDTGVKPAVTQLKNAQPKTGLYVGNSFTYYNCGVNGYVRGFTKEEKRDWTARMITISAGMLSFHDVESYLKNHEMDPYFKDDKKPAFDVVFLQGQSVEPISKDRVPVFKKYLKQHIEAVRRAGAEPVVVDTWARQDKPEQTRLLADAIITEGNANNALVLPVGLAFAESLKGRPDLILHHTDKRHPSAAGSYLYGAVIYSMLFKKSPEGFKFLGDCAKPIKAEDAAYLQQVAWRVTKEFYGWK